MAEALITRTSRGAEQEQDGVIPRKLFKIGEVMHYAGLSRQTVHNYTMLGLITEEARTESGHRLYGEDVFERLERIKKLRASKTLKEIREILDRETAIAKNRRDDVSHP